MKLKNIFLALGGAMLLSCSFASCSDDEEYDFDGIPYTRIYFANPKALVQCAVTKTPVGNFFSFDGEKSIKTTAPTNSTLNVEFAIDYNLVEEYNKANGTNFEVAPDGLFSLSTNSLTIEADTVASKEGIAVRINEYDVDKLEAGKSYLIPVVITKSSDSNFRPSSNVGCAYYAVTVSTKLLNDEATLDGLTKLDKTGWTLTTNDTGASNLDKAFDNNTTTYVKFSKGTDIEVIIDLGSETYYKAIELYSPSFIYGFREVSIEYSIDGVDWGQIGTLPFVRSTSLAAVLYGSIPSRYIRLKGDFYYASYPTYCRIYEFSLYN
ncbi:MAG: BT_3987 domain-containing protein [Muribaculaceae bacterium]